MKGEEHWPRSQNNIRTWVRNNNRKKSTNISTSSDFDLWTLNPFYKHAHNIGHSRCSSVTLIRRTLLLFYGWANGRRTDRTHDVWLERSLSEMMIVMCWTGRCDVIANSRCHGIRASPHHIKQARARRVHWLTARLMQSGSRDIFETFSIR